MNLALRRTAGTIFIIIGLAGSVLGLWGIVKVWRWRTPLNQAVQANLSLASEMLTSSANLMILVNDTLQNASAEIEILLQTLESLTALFKDADPALEAVLTLTGESLPKTISATQNSLETARGSADIIDNILKAVSAIPFFPGDPYDPQTPLSESLVQISSSLDSITPALADIQTSLSDIRQDVGFIGEDLIRITANTRQVQKNLEEAKLLLETYQEQINDAQTRLYEVQLKAPVWVDRLAWAVTIVITWISFTQLGLLLQGLLLVTKTSLD